MTEDGRRWDKAGKQEITGTQEGEGGRRTEDKGGAMFNIQCSISNVQVEGIERTVSRQGREGREGSNGDF